LHGFGRDACTDLAGGSGACLWKFHAGNQVSIVYVTVESSLRCVQDTCPLCPNSKAMLMRSLHKAQCTSLQGGFEVHWKETVPSSGDRFRFATMRHGGRDVYCLTTITQQPVCPLRPSALPSATRAAMLCQWGSFRESGSLCE